MKIDKTKWERKRLTISQLKPHPDQERLYAGTTSSGEDRAFARNLANRGQVDDVHVLPFPNAAGLPENTVLDGWRRATLSKANGESEVDCVIRHDLVHATAAEVAVEFANFNPNRRQLTKLALARNIKYQIQMQRSNSGRLSSRDTERLKKEVGEQFQVDIRTVNRYLAILDSPPAAQQAYDRGEISQVDAAKIGTLFSPVYGANKKNEQREFLNRIATGEPIVKVVCDYIDTCKTHATNAKAAKPEAEEDALTRLAKAIRDLGTSDKTIPVIRIVTWAKTLKTGKQLIERLLARCDR